jgi:hypothetical protein
MLREAFEEAAPYISNLKEISKFVEEFQGKREEEILREIDRRIKSASPTLSTDYRILREKFEEIINKGK